MTYFCFIESSISSVPHMEPLVSEEADPAIAEATNLMRRHSHAIAAHIFLDNEHIATVSASDPAVILWAGGARQNAATRE